MRKPRCSAGSQLEPSANCRSWAKRHVSGGTKTNLGRACRNAFLGLAKTCRKLGISFWNYLSARLDVPSAPAVPRLAELIRCRGQPA